ncbi:MAG TPA: DUF4097 family beta strand repeat-containing protein [Pyrinomonadaceae bacterium]|nr:DUF4097 family beta strand repeat-containing protein [Pyrinomonadaceae bacterium]
MAERCHSCGAELFTGQQFCRACGARTRQFSSEELPTQMLPQGEQSQQQQPTVPEMPLNTSPLPGRNTSDPVYGMGYDRYQPPHVPAQQQRATAPVYGMPPQPPPRRARAWVYAIVGLLIFFAGASVVAGLFFLNRATTPRRMVKAPARPHVVVPPIPPPHPMDVEEAAEAAAEGGAQSVITKTYPLAKDGSFSLRNFSGDITIEGWDEQQAEVKMIKRGGAPVSPDDPLVSPEQAGNRLVFNSMPDKTRGAREVEYVVKLPRNLRELEINSINSNVELTNVSSASISVNVQRGNIELEDVSGTINSRTTKGNTTVVLSEAAKDAPQIFNGIHGNVELELAPGTNAELKAETLDGRIEVDEDLGIKVEQRTIGRQAVGRLGSGGQPIVVKVISGNIKIHN